MEADLTDLEHWNKLEDKWEEANKVAREAQVALDFKMRNHILSGKEAPGPNREDQEALSKLWVLETKYRDQMDAFITERSVD